MTTKTVRLRSHVRYTDSTFSNCRQHGLISQWHTGFCCRISRKRNNKSRKRHPGSTTHTDKPNTMFFQNSLKGCQWITSQLFRIYLIFIIKASKIISVLFLYVQIWPSSSRSKPCLGIRKVCATPQEEVSNKLQTFKQLESRVSNMLRKQAQKLADRQRQVADISEKKWRSLYFTMLEGTSKYTYYGFGGLLRKFQDGQQLSQGKPKRASKMGLLSEEGS